MATKTIRIGVIGCGQRVQHVLHNLSKVPERDQLKVVALYDPHPKAAESLKSEVAPQANICTSDSELISRSDVDWVMISSWNCHHANQAVAALEAGKHVFCEKPLATTIEDCVRLKNAHNAHPDRIFFFGLVLRYTTFYQKVKEVIDSGDLGDIISFEFNETLSFNHGGYIHGNWRRYREYAGTHLLEKCCHDFDIANWLIGSVPVKAASFGGKDFFLPKSKHLADALGTNSNGQPAYQTWKDPHRVDPFSEGATVVDNQVAILQYANGARATFHTNCNTGLPERRFYIAGTKGTLRADVCTGTIQLARISFTEAPQTILSPGDLKAGDGHYGGDVIMARHIAETMLHGNQPLAGLDDGIRSAISCFGVDAALDSGSVVDYTPLWKIAGISV